MNVDLLITTVSVNPFAVAVLGGAIGLLSGLFGVGGGFSLTPMLNIVFGIPYNVAVGSGLTQIFGTSVSAASRHKGLGNIDFKLAFFMLMGALPGAEIGVRSLVGLKNAGHVVLKGRQVPIIDIVLPVSFLVLLISIGSMVIQESRKARKQGLNNDRVETAIGNWIRTVRIKPMISLPRSGIHQIPIFFLVVLGLGVGFLSGLLGVGGGCILLPAMVYVIGIPTKTAVGTDIFHIIFVAAFGTVSHTIKGHVDLILVLLLLSGSLIGAQIGASLTKKIRAANIRFFFSFIIYAAAIMIILDMARDFFLRNNSLNAVDTGKGISLSYIILCIVAPVILAFIIAFILDKLRKLRQNNRVATISFPQN